MLADTALTGQDYLQGTQQFSFLLPAAPSSSTLSKRAWFEKVLERVLGGFSSSAAKRTIASRHDLEHGFSPFPQLNALAFNIGCQNVQPWSRIGRNPHRRLKNAIAVRSDPPRLDGGHAETVGRVNCRPETPSSRRMVRKPHLYHR